MPVHELESAVADAPHEGVGDPGEEGVGWILCVCPAHHLLIMIAGDIHRIHVGEAIQKSPAPIYNAGEWIAQQFEKIPDNDQLSSLVLDMPEEGVEK
jgi:hypothetical protein